MSTFNRTLAAIAAVVASGVSHAGFTPINHDAPGSEPCLVGASIAGLCADGKVSILQTLRTSNVAGNTLFGQSFTRVDDSLDKVWSTLTAAGGQVQFRARYAGDRSQLGLMPLSSGSFNRPGDFNFLLDVSSTNNVVDLTDGPWVSVSASFNPFVWVLRNCGQGGCPANNPSAGLFLSSDTSIAGFDNSGSSADWMVTHRASNGNFVIGWEDRTNLNSQGRPNDFDYNDFVFELRNVRNGVPEPGTLALVGLSLLGLGFAGRMRKR